MPLSPDQLQSVGPEHLQRRNVDVAIGNQLCRQLGAARFNSTMCSSSIQHSNC
jgi:hypothetical protein